jgi:hypothetical protein
MDALAAAFQANVALALQAALPEQEMSRPMTYGEVKGWFRVKEVDRKLRQRAARHFEQAARAGIVLQ